MQNETLKVVLNAAGIALVYVGWFSLVWVNKAPVDGFIAGVISLSSFLTGHVVGKVSAGKQISETPTKETPNVQVG